MHLIRKLILLEFYLSIVVYGIYDTAKDRKNSVVYDMPNFVRTGNIRFGNIPIFTN